MGGYCSTALLMRQFQINATCIAEHGGMGASSLHSRTQSPFPAAIETLELALLLPFNRGDSSPMS